MVLHLVRSVISKYILPTYFHKKKSFQQCPILKAVFCSKFQFWLTGSIAVVVCSITTHLILHSTSTAEQRELCCILSLCVDSRLAIYSKGLEHKVGEKEANLPFIFSA